MTIQTYDVLIIGGGSAGYAAARTAAESGARVAIADHGPLGGLCILRGCMPSKALLRSAAVASEMRRAEEFGFLPVEVQADFGAMVERKNRLVAEFARDRIAALKDPRFTLYQAPASFVSPYEMRVGEVRVQARAMIIATGSVVREVPIPGLAEAGFLTSDSAMELRQQPSSMVVLGGGSIATELGQFFARTGTRVCLVQRGRTLLSDQDEDVGRALEAALRWEGMEIWTDAELLRVTRDGSKRTVHFMHQGRQRTVTADTLLHALGRGPNVAGLNLRVAGVESTDDGVTVGPDMRTSQPHIFAVGDVNGLMQVVHQAIQQGEIAAYNATHPNLPPKRFDRRLDTEVVFTDPQVAVAGLSETTCRTRGVAYLAASYPFADHGKAMCLGAAHGFVKLLCHPQTGQLLGAHIVGPEAGELIHELLAILYYHGTVHDLVRIPHYHPTLAEIVTYPAEELIAQLKRQDE